MPYKFSPNLFDAILYPEEETRDFNITHIILSGWAEYWRITLRYGMTRCPILNMRYCESCLYYTDIFKNMRVCIIECSFEAEKDNLINLLLDRKFRSIFLDLIKSDYLPSRLLMLFDSRILTLRFIGRKSLKNRFRSIQCFYDQSYQFNRFLGTDHDRFFCDRFKIRTTTTQLVHSMIGW